MINCQKATTPTVMLNRNNIIVALSADHPTQ